MNEIEEQRVIEALRAIPGGLTVTEHDIIDAGTRIKQNLKAPAPRRNRALLAVAAAVVLIIGVVAFQAITGDEKSAQPPADQPSAAEALREQLQPDGYKMDGFMDGTPPTAQQLPGLWLLRPPFVTADANLVDGDGDVFFGAPSALGPFIPAASFSGAELTRTWGPDSGECSEVGTQTFRTVVAPDGSLHVLLTRGKNACMAADGREVWDRAAVGSPIADYMATAAEEADWQTFDASSALSGVYLAPQTGDVLDIHPNGRYRFYDNLTADDIVATDRGELESSPGKLSGSCTGGSFSGGLEAATIPAVEDLFLAADALRFTSETSSCESGIADAGLWVRFLTG